MDSARRTAEKSIVSSRVKILSKIPLHSSFKDAAEKLHAERVEADTGAPSGVAKAYVRLTAKQTRANFIVEVARASAEGLAWFWGQVCSFFSRIADWFRSGKDVIEPMSLNLLSSFVDLVAVCRRKSKWLSGALHTLFSPLHHLGAVRNSMIKMDRWFSSHPRTKLVFEEVAYAAQCLLVAFGEEFAKRYAPWQISALFGAVEALIESVAKFIDEPFSRDAIASEITKGLIRIVAHTVLRLLPMWVAVPVHAIINWLAARNKPRIWSYLTDLLVVESFERELEAFLCEDIRVPMSVPINRVRESKIYLKEPDGTKVPIAKVESFLQEASMPMESDKIVSLSTNVTNLVVRPASSVLDMVLMEVARLEKPLPYEASEKAWREAMLVFNQAYVDDLLEESGPLRPFDEEQMVAYIQDRPWTASRKEETIAIVRKWKDGSKLKKPREINPKGDEAIPNQPDFVDPSFEGDEGGVATKTRPICPREEADLPAMAIAVPLKAYIGGHRWWKDQGGRFVRVFDPEVETEWMLSIDYQYKPRADALSAWMNKCRRFHGVHVAMHGDDNWTLLVDKHGEYLASGIDLSNCDKSCGKWMQLAFCNFLNRITDMECQEDVKRQYDLLVGEFNLKSRKFPPGTPFLYWLKDIISTNTGEPLTSVKAVFAQFPAIFMTVRACIVMGEFRPNLYKQAVEVEWKKLGLIPEFETDQFGNVWHHPSAVTYLGGMFAELRPGTRSDWGWVSNKHLKAYFLFPATDKIYGGRFHMQMHMCMLLADPDLQSGPVGRALSRWYMRVVEATFGDLTVRMVEDATAKYERHLMRTDRYKLEMKRDMGQYEAPIISDEAYVRAAAFMLNRHNRFELFSDIMKLVHEIDTFDSRPRQKAETSAEFLYVLRFGEPKRKTGQSCDEKGKEEFLPELSMVGSFLNLSAKIFTFVKEMTKTKAQKAKAKAMKSQKQAPQQQKKSGTPQQKAQNSRKRKSNKQRGDGFPVGMQGRGRRSNVCVEDEYIGEVTGSVAFAVTQYAVNPGVAATFPWLSQKAKLYERYRFKKLEFYYKPEVTQFSANGIGKVILAADYDAGDAPPATKQQAEDTRPENDGLPYETIDLKLNAKELAASLQWHFVRPGGLPGRGDIKTFDCATLNVCTIGQAAAAVVGELRVRYVVELDTPVLENAVGAPINYSVGLFQSTAPEAAGASGVAKTLALATAAINGIGATSALGSITPPAGNYILDAAVQFNWSGTTDTNAIINVLKNGVAIAPAGTGSSFVTATHGAENVSQHPLYVSCNGSDVLTLTATTSYSAGTATVLGSVRLVSV